MYRLSCKTMTDMCLHTCEGQMQHVWTNPVRVTVRYTEIIIRCCGRIFGTQSTTTPQFPIRVCYSSPFWQRSLSHTGFLAVSNA